MAKVLFENFKKDKNKLYLQDEKISLLESELSFNETIFKYIFEVSDRGINCEATFENLSNKDINSGIERVGHENDDNEWSLEEPTHENLRKHGFNYDYDISSMKFTDCDFHKEPIFSSSKLDNIYFKNCTFSCKIEEIFKTNPDKKIIFVNCQFDNITFNQYEEKDKIKNFELYGGTIKELNIFNNTISEKFYINKQYDGNNKITTIDKLLIENTIFKENFKLHNCHVKKMKIKDTDFDKNADFYKSEFKSYLSSSSDEDNNETIYFSALNFRSLALFGECFFGEQCSFKYVTFEGYSHFRGAHFKKGLDLDYTNIQKEMNFFGVIGLDSEESKKNTSQETYRILKHNFQKIGNQIEANKYQTLELLTHNKNTWNREDINPSLLSDGIISFLNLITSYFSKYWVLPLFWIFLVGVISANILGDVTLANIIKYATITQYKDLKEYAPLFLFNKASLGFLYYQFIQSIRKNTKN